MPLTLLNILATMHEQELLRQVEALEEKARQMAYAYTALQNLKAELMQQNETLRTALAEQEQKWQEADALYQRQNEYAPEVAEEQREELRRMIDGYIRKIDENIISLNQAL